MRIFSIKKNIKFLKFCNIEIKTKNIERTNAPHHHHHHHPVTSWLAETKGVCSVSRSAMQIYKR